MGLVVILFFFGLAGGVVGRMKGSSFFLWFLISACVPFLGLLTEFPDVAIASEMEVRERRLAAGGPTG